jgi:hypothetical protein
LSWVWVGWGSGTGARVIRVIVAIVAVVPNGNSRDGQGEREEEEVRAHDRRTERAKGVRWAMGWDRWVAKVFEKEGFYTKKRQLIPRNACQECP